MKIVASLLALLSWPAFAAETPPSPCGGYQCPPRVLEIAQGFETGSAITTADLPLLGSGECHHLNDNYDVNTVHYGAIFLDPKDGQVYMGGAFSFFAPENPYKDWTPEKVRRENTNLYAENHRVELTDGFAFSDMNPGKTPIWFYWIKQKGPKIYLMGHWGVWHRVLCELEKHE